MNEALNVGDVYITPHGDKAVCRKEGWVVGKFPLDGDGYKLHKRKENIKTHFNIGDKIDGFCNGHFGRDDYETKKCVYATSDYAVFEYEEGGATVLNFNDDKELFWSEAECWRVKQ